MKKYEHIYASVDRYFESQYGSPEFAQQIEEQIALLEDKLFGQIIYEEERYQEPIRNSIGQPVCPKCGRVMHKHGTYAVKKQGKQGLTAAGRTYQRYRCSDAECRFVFSEKPRRTAVSSSKLTRHQWHTFIKAELHFLTIRQAAKLCGVSDGTAYTMRHRLYEALQKDLPTFVVYPGEECWIDEKAEYDSYSGNHKKIDLAKIRSSYRRGRAFEKAASGQHQPRQASLLCVVWAVKDNGELYARIANRGMRVEEAAGREALADRFHKNATVHTDENKTYRRIFEDTGVDLIQTYANDYKMNPINTVHSNFSLFMRRFRGVSTRRLDNYLQFFIWISRTLSNLRITTEDIKAAERVVAKTELKETRADFRNAPIPFIDWWEGERGIKARWEQRQNTAQWWEQYFQKQLYSGHADSSLEDKIVFFRGKQLECAQSLRDELAEKGFAPV